MISALIRRLRYLSKSKRNDRAGFCPSFHMQILNPAQAWAQLVIFVKVPRKPPRRIQPPKHRKYSEHVKDEDQARSP
jgi:hypothetical protein